MNNNLSDDRFIFIHVYLFSKVYEFFWIFMNSLFQRLDDFNA